MPTPARGSAGVEGGASAEGLEASDGFGNGLMGSLGFTGLVFPLDSSKTAQLARCCSEGRSCVGDKQRLQLDPPFPPEGRCCPSNSHFCTRQGAPGTLLDAAVSHKG